jgi:hypothetical protein
VALKQRGPDQTHHGECRECRTFCDKLIEPRGCLELRCRFLYSYHDPLSGNRFMGCVNKVFAAEIDIDLFEDAELTGGYGGIKLTGTPMPQCQFQVEPSYEGSGPAYSCVNPKFFDCADDISVFDLRDALA